MTQTHQIELSAGTIEYPDTGGAGLVILLVHGLPMDSTLWEGVTAELSRDHRCVIPILPLGAHRRAMGPGADLSLEAIAGLLLELIERLDLTDVTLVGNDTGGAIVQLLAGDRACGTDRLRRWAEPDLLIGAGVPVTAAAIALITVRERDLVPPLTGDGRAEQGEPEPGLAPPRAAAA